MANGLMGFDTHNCVESRKKLSKYLGIGKYQFFKKLIKGVNKFWDGSILSWKQIAFLTGI